MLVSLIILYPLMYTVLGLSWYVEQLSGRIMFENVIYYLQICVMIDQLVFYRTFKMVVAWVKSEYRWNVPLVIWSNSTDIAQEELDLFVTRLNEKFQPIGLEFVSFQFIPVSTVENVYRFALTKNLFAYHIFYLDEVVHCKSMPGQILKMGRSYDFNNVVREIIKGLQISNYFYKGKPWEELDDKMQNKYVFSIFRERAANVELRRMI